MKVKIADRLFDFQLIEKTESQIKVKIGDKVLTAEYIPFSENQFTLKINGSVYRIFGISDKNQYYLNLNGTPLLIEKIADTEQLESSATGGAGKVHLSDNKIKAPMPGKILKIFVSEGQQVDANTRLFILEAMKMENEVVAPQAGKIKKILFAENDMVSVGDAIIEMDFDGLADEKG